MEQSKEIILQEFVGVANSYWCEPVLKAMQTYAEQQVKKALALNSEFTPVGDLNLRSDKRYIVSGESKEVITDAVYDGDDKKWWDSQCIEIVGVTHAMEVPEFHSSPTQTKIQLLTIIEERDKRIKELESVIAGGNKKENMKIPKPKYVDKCDRQTIHLACCKNCPSANPNKCQEEIDMDNDIRPMGKTLIAKEILFACAWRPTKLCKGICDQFEIDQQFLSNLYTPPINS